MPVKSKVEISQNCVAFSEYMNFKPDFENVNFHQSKIVTEFSLCKINYDVSIIFALYLHLFKFAQEFKIIENKWVGL